MSVPPPRLHVLFRPGCGRAVVFRRGPSTVFCTIGWDVERDAFTVGQWCKHKLYGHRSDLSDDGQWMVYLALKCRWQSKGIGAFTALSRAPYLKAVRLWPQGDTWGGGGLFCSGPEELGPDSEHLFDELPRIDARNRLTTGGYADRLRRDGWARIVGEGGKRTNIYEKALGTGFVLRKRVMDETSERHELRGPDGSLRGLDGWEWAELDAPRQRVVWAEAGVLQAARVGSRGLGEPWALHDFRDMTFEPLEAPYRDATVIERG